MGLPVRGILSSANAVSGVGFTLYKLEGGTAVTLGADQCLVVHSIKAIVLTDATNVLVTGGVDENDTDADNILLEFTTDSSAGIHEGSIKFEPTALVLRKGFGLFLTTDATGQADAFFLGEIV